MRSNRIPDAILALVVAQTIAADSFHSTSAGHRWSPPAAGGGRKKHRAKCFARARGRRMRRGR